MAERYSAAVIPGRVRRPKDKPSAENTVWHATMALAGVMRDRSFGSLDECNSRPFQKRDGSRRSVFESEERPLLIPLPGTAYEVADWIYGRKVQSNCHVAYARNWYSVPYAYAGATAGLRVGSDMLEVWHKGSGLCTHRLLPSTAVNRYSTNETDLPGKTVWRQRDRGCREKWARRVGPDCADVVVRLFAAQRFDDQGVEPALAVPRLSRRYSERRLERACPLGPAVGDVAKVLAHQANT